MSVSGWQRARSLGVLLVLLGGVAPLLAQTGGINGICKGEKGEVLAGYPVIIERQEVKGSYPTKTNKKGEYTYIGLPTGNYKIILKTPSGADLFFINTHVSFSEVNEVNFDLAKEKVHAQEERTKQLAANPELQRQVQEQEKAQKQATSLKEMFDQGEALLQEKKYPEAAAIFEQTLPLAKGGNIAIVLAKLGETYDKARQFDKAMENYRKAAEANPTDSDLHNNMGNVLAEMGKSAEALQEFQKAAEINPAKAARYYFNLGAVSYNLGRMDDAVGAFRKATEIDSTYADAFFWLGQALMGKATMTPDGKIVAVPGTAEALQTYLKLQPDGPNAAVAQQLLQTIQGQIQIQYKAEKKKKK